MQNLILLAVIVVGFFYALYRTYKNSDGSGEGGGCSGCCSSCPMAGGCAKDPADADR
ncbi:MAG: FeoB-associated Cys-rich membrane protein [Clostridiales bacterium]|nr:FeoB-associated Cys-rich membrane protein [Clostridiales bacterium]